VAFAQNQRDEVRDLGDKSGALMAEPGMKQQTYVAVPHILLDDQGGSQISVRTDEKSPTLRAEAHGNVPAVVCMATQQGGAEIRTDDKAPTITAAAGMSGNNQPVGCLQGNIVRRLTPAECARLQGFPDRWGDIDEQDSFTPEEYEFWLNVRNTHAAINGRAAKDYTEAQMLTWYNKLRTDSAEYKMWGNGIALPPALYCMQGISDVLHKEDEE
jgi:DNA (cytosine-5)-methyltransferase 1